jgi:hypothetical protein
MERPAASAVRMNLGPGSAPAAPEQPAAAVRQANTHPAELAFEVRIAESGAPAAPTAPWQQPSTRPAEPATPLARETRGDTEVPRSPGETEIPRAALGEGPRRTIAKPEAGTPAAAHVELRRRPFQPEEPASRPPLPPESVRLNLVRSEIPPAGLRSSEPPPAPVRAAVLADERPVTPTPPGPVRELRLRIPDAGQSGGVEVQIKDRPSEVSVAVRARSPELAQTLRQGLPELAERLGEQGVQAQFWRPAGSEPLGRSLETGLRTPEADLGGWSEEGDASGRRHPDSQDQPQQDPEDNPSQWTEEMARSFGAPAED